MDTCLSIIKKTNGKLYKCFYFCFIEYYCYCFICYIYDSAIENSLMTNYVTEF